MSEVISGTYIPMMAASAYHSRISCREGWGREMTASTPRAANAILKDDGAHVSQFSHEIAHSVSKEERE